MHFVHYSVPNRIQIEYSVQAYFFYTRLKRAGRRLCTGENYGVFVVDRELAVTNAIKKTLQQAAVVYCWNDIIGDMRGWVKGNGSNSADEHSTHHLSATCLQQTHLPNTTHCWRMGNRSGHRLQHTPRIICHLLG